MRKIAVLVTVALVDAARPQDEHGESTELEELVQLVEVMRRSALWRRAQAAALLLIEVPFSLSLLRDELRIMGFAPHAAEEVAGSPWAAPRQIVEGLIDLAFQEQGGWVIADYTRDVFPSPEIRRERTAQYRRQVELYAACWSRITGDPVKERILFFTSEGREESW